VTQYEHAEAAAMASVKGYKSRVSFLLYTTPRNHILTSSELLSFNARP
jgi:hypothetical protein